MDQYPISSSQLGMFFQVNGKTLNKNYKEHLSGFRQWDQLPHCEQWVLYPKNVGSHLCIDEVAMTSGELYTIVTNANVRTQKGSLVAMIKGTQASMIENVLQGIPAPIRNLVKDVSTDLAPTMQKVAVRCFEKARLVSDRFHVQQLVTTAVQEVRLRHRRQAISRENAKVKAARRAGTKYEPELVENGDTLKQLLARSRYLLFKPKSKWSTSQKERARILFENYPDIRKAYELSMYFRSIFEKASTPQEAASQFNKWHAKVAKYDDEGFITASETIKVYEQSILQYFEKKKTNALAETFNSKIKSFRRIYRGVQDLPFFLFRVANIFA